MRSRACMFSGLFLLAFAVRAIGYPRVFTGAGVQLPFAGDAYYHLRRIWFSVARFPETLPFDPYVSFPTGSEIVWPATFDWAIAAAIRPFVDATDQAAVEALAVFAPVVLGAATAGAVALLADRLYGRCAGWIAGMLYALLPMSFMFSRLGMIDHHVAVALIGTCVIWIAVDLIETAHANDDRFGRPIAMRAVALGLATAFALLVWPGFLLHAGVVQVALGIWWLSAADTRSARARAQAFALGQGVVAVCIAPFSLGLSWREYGGWSPLVLSSFQPLYFAAAAVAVLVASRIHERSHLGGSRPRRLASALGIALLGAGLALVAIPSLQQAVVAAAGWFTQEEELLGRINEMRPVLMRRGHFDPGFALKQFGAPIIALPIVWVHLVRRELGERRAAHAFVLLWALAFFVLTLMQWRFGNTLAVVYVILIGAAVAAWVGRVRSQWPSLSRAVVAGTLLVVGLTVWTANDWIRSYGTLLRSSLRALEDESFRDRGPLRPKIRIFDDAARWIARETPTTAGYLDPAVAPEYGVLTSWGMGHLSRYRAERPMVQDNFGPYAGRASFEGAWAYFAETDESLAIDLLDRLGVRYVVAGRMGAGSLDGLAANAMARRLGRAYGSAVRFESGLGASGLERHRLLFHADSRPAGPANRRIHAPVPHESVGVWEIVAGAEIEGLAPPGETVSLALKLSASSGATHVYRRLVRADPDGRYRFVVPYSTEGARFSPDIRTARDYRIGIGQSVSALRVHERDVIAGAKVRGPDLRGAGPAASSPGARSTSAAFDESDLDPPVRLLR